VPNIGVPSNVDLLGGLVRADLDTLVIALYCFVDDLLGPAPDPAAHPASATPS
jgi:hypothetical protein